MPCGVALTKRSHVQKVEHRIDYLNSVDTTIMGSRNGHAALHMWHSLRTKGLDGIKADVAGCLRTAAYLRDQLTKAGITCRLNDLSSTVVLERPAHEPFVKKWQLACEEDIAHVVVMPNVTCAKVDVFVGELAASIAEHGHTRPARDDSPLALLGSSSWGGALEQ
jgi:histidine decarboxylase